MPRKIFQIPVGRKWKKCVYSTFSRHSSIVGPPVVGDSSGSRRTRSHAHISTTRAFVSIRFRPYYVDHGNVLKCRQGLWHFSLMLRCVRGETEMNIFFEILPSSCIFKCFLFFGGCEVKKKAPTRPVDIPPFMGFRKEQCVKSKDCGVFLCFFHSFSYSSSSFFATRRGGWVETGEPGWYFSTPPLPSLNAHRSPSHPTLYPPYPHHLRSHDALVAAAAAARPATLLTFGGGSAQPCKYLLNLILCIFVLFYSKEGRFETIEPFLSA